MRGYVLSVDPASNACGVSLWKDGQYVSSALLTSDSPRDYFTLRVQTIVLQLSRFLGPILGEEKIHTIISEDVRSKLVHLSFGSILTCAYIQAHIKTKGSFISPSAWKSWAKLRGATGDFKAIKGVKALRECGWDFTKYPVESDDIADSILIYLTWRDKYDTGSAR